MAPSKGSERRAGFDRRRLLTFALLWYAVGHAISALSPDYAWLLPVRALTMLAAAVFTPQAAAARRIQGFHELDGLEFIARIDVEKDGRGEAKNVVKMAVEPGEPEYAALMAGAGFSPNRTAGVPTAVPTAHSAASPTAVAQPPAQRPAVSGKPAWAQ